MSKLFKLKEWFTMPEAAKYLSQVFAEDVTEADILRLAIDRRLTLSVHLPNGAEVKRGKIVTHSLDDLTKAVVNNNVPENLNWVTVPKSFYEQGLAAINDDSGDTMPFITSIRIKDTQWITLNQEKVVSVWGLWDLPMIGGERLDIEHLYQIHTGGPSITAETLDGAFIWRGPDDICQIQADFDDNEYRKGSKAQELELERRILESNMEVAEAEKLRADFDIKRKEYKEERRKQPYHKNYYPSDKLPDDAVLVVRTEILKALEQSIVEPSDKEIGTRERDTLYKIIIGMAVRGYSHDPKAQRSSAIADIVRDLEHLGVPVSDDTVRKYIKEAAELLDGRAT